MTTHRRRQKHPSPSDQRRAAARAKGLVSDRIKINRDERKRMKAERKADKAKLTQVVAEPAPVA